MQSSLQAELNPSPRKCQSPDQILLLPVLMAHYVGESIHRHFGIRQLEKICDRGK
jgi:hypothetical protein